MTYTTIHTTNLLDLKLWPPPLLSSSPSPLVFLIHAFSYNLQGKSESGVICILQFLRVRRTTHLVNSQASTGCHSYNALATRVTQENSIVHTIVQFKSGGSDSLSRRQFYVSYFLPEIIIIFITDVYRIKRMSKSGKRSLHIPIFLTFFGL